MKLQKELLIVKFVPAFYCILYDSFAVFYNFFAAVFYLSSTESVINLVLH